MNRLPVWNGFVLKLVNKNVALTKADTEGPSCVEATIWSQIANVLNNSSRLSRVPPELDTDDKPDTTNSRGQDSTRLPYTLSQPIIDVNVRLIPASLRTSPFKEQSEHSASDNMSTLEEMFWEMTLRSVKVCHLK